MHTNFLISNLSRVSCRSSKYNFEPKWKGDGRNISLCCVSLLQMSAYGTRRSERNFFSALFGLVPYATTGDGCCNHHVMDGETLIIALY